jgi:hypothetical protein
MTKPRKLRKGSRVSVKTLETPFVAMVTQVLHNAMDIGSGAIIPLVYEVRSERLNLHSYRLRSELRALPRRKSK